MASLLAELQESGSRRSNGDANAAGKVYAYIPNTSTPVNLYTDEDLTSIATQPITLDNGGRVPRSDYPDGLWVTQKIRLLVQDEDGNTVSDTTFIPASAGNTAIDNDATTVTDLDAYITKVQTSTGGQDALYLESAGATARTLKAKLAEGGISVKDFGAVGDGDATDTTAIQAAFSRAKALSCNVIFPAGTYKTDQAITLTGATGVHVVGVGRGAVLIKPTHATANGFTLSTCTDCGFHGMSILHASGSTGAAIAAAASPRFKATDVYSPANGTFVGFAYGIDMSGAGDFDHIAYCEINADTVAIRSNTTSSSKPQVLIGCQLGAASGAPVSPTSALEINGGNGDYSILGCRIVGATNNILFNSSWTGTTVEIYGGSVGSVSGSTAINLSGFAGDRDVRWSNCGVDGYTTNVLSGATVTPDRSQGRHIRIRGTTTGSAYVVAAPTPAPSLGSTRDLDLYLTFFNNAGGAVTGWTMNAAYHLSAGPSTTNLELTSYHLKWDADASVWREFSRSVTT